MRIQMKRTLYLISGTMLAWVALSCSDDDATGPDTQPPQASITQPARGDTLETDTTQVRVSATDNVGVASVELFVDHTSLGADSLAPYAWDWESAAWGNDGFHDLYAAARDEAGNEGLSDTIVVYIPVSTAPDPNPPTVTITSPIEGAEILESVTIRAEASDDVGVDSVAFYAGGERLGVDVDAPYEQLWDIGVVPVLSGQYELWAWAYDAAGNVGADTVTVTLPEDTTPPVVSVTAPPGGQVTAEEDVVASASDAGGVALVRFYLDGVLVGTDDEEPFEQPAIALLYWADGLDHDLEAEAEDNAGNTARSDIVTLLIVRPETADLTQVLAAAGPGQHDEHAFERLSRLNPEVRYVGSQIDTIDVDTCILGNGALIDYMGLGCLLVRVGADLHETRFDIDHAIVINGNRFHDFGGAIEYGSIDGRAYTRGKVTHCTIYKSTQSGIYLWRSQPDHVEVSNSILHYNINGGLVRYTDDVTPNILYNCSNGNNGLADFGEHCGCPDNVTPDELNILDPQERLGTNITTGPVFVPVSKIYQNNRQLREHFLLHEDSPCRTAGRENEEITYQGALPPE